MAMKVTNIPAPVGARATSLFTGSLANAAHSVTVWRKKRQTINTLNKLSSRELDDLGIERGDIEAIASRAANY